MVMIVSDNNSLWEWPSLFCQIGRTVLDRVRLRVTYHAASLVQFAQLRPDEGRYLLPQERLHRHRDAQVLQALVDGIGGRSVRHGLAYA